MTLTQAHMILGSQPGMTSDELHQLWRTAAARAHPDKIKDGDYAGLFHKVSQAYEMVSKAEALTGLIQFDDKTLGVPDEDTLENIFNALYPLESENRWNATRLNIAFKQFKTANIQMSRELMTEIMYSIIKDTEYYPTIKGKFIDIARGQQSCQALDSCHLPEELFNKLVRVSGRIGDAKTWNATVSAVYTQKYLELTCNARSAPRNRAEFIEKREELNNSFNEFIQHKSKRQYLVLSNSNQIANR